MAVQIRDRIKALLESAQGEIVPMAALLETGWGENQEGAQLRLRVLMCELRREYLAAGLELIGRRFVGYQLQAKP